MKLHLPLVLGFISTACMLSGAAPKAPAEPAPLHCQVPCGIYGDRMRIDAVMEDAQTVEKAMTKIGEFTKEGNMNQVVRWVNAKDEHAQKIQDTVAAYFLAQRIKKPADTDGRAKYLRQLELMHDATVAAMKCKQTTDPANVAALRTAFLEFSGTYFERADLEHIHGHHGPDGGK